MANEYRQNSDPSAIDSASIENDIHCPLKVLYVTHDSNLTGASRSLLDLLSGLDRSQIEPIVVLRRHGPLEEKLKEIDVPYKIIRYVKATKSPSKSRPGMMKDIINYFAAQKISKFIKHNNIDLVHQNSLLIDVGMKAALRAQIPYICHLRELVKEQHGFDFLNESHQANLVRKSNAAIAISFYVAEYYSDWAPRQGLSIVYDGLNIDNYYFSHDSILNKGTVELLLPGRITPVKCQLEAVKAVEILIKTNTNVHLTIVGSIGNENYVHEIERFINEHNLGSNIDIKEFTDDMKALYSQADISLTCSQNEAMGRITIEGMLAGCLVIGANVGATPEIIMDGENGLLYEAGEPQALADRINYAITHPREMRIIATNAQNRAKEKFNNSIYAGEIAKLYRDVIMIPEDLDKNNIN